MPDIEKLREERYLIKAGLDKLVRENAKSDTIWRYLHENNVVIEVKRKLPDGLCMPGDFRHPNWLKKSEVEAIMDLAVVPLIDEQTEVSS